MGIDQENILAPIGLEIRPMAYPNPVRLILLL
jgi:hypothetical protein